MDFQATTTKFAVIEYMTKYITKAGQGNMVHVMEHSFSLCLEKAREMERGVGTAIQKWFNLQSMSEAKSQLENMHLNYDLPRFLSTRDFRRLSTRAARKRVKVREEVTQAHAGERPLQDSLKESLGALSLAEMYLAQGQFAGPDEGKLQERHPLTGHSLWQVIVKDPHGPSSVNGESSLHDHRDQVKEAWPAFVQRLSWWEYVRFFKKQGQTLRYKPFADVVSVVPCPRLRHAMDDAQWCSALRDALLPFCNHGPLLPTFIPTFANAAALDAMEVDGVKELMERFVNATMD